MSLGTHYLHAVPHSSQWSIVSTPPRSPYAFPSREHGSSDHKRATLKAGEAAVSTALAEYADVDDTTTKECENYTRIEEARRSITRQP
jgi:hypothetical protein